MALSSGAGVVAPATPLVWALRLFGWGGSNSFRQQGLVGGVSFNSTASGGTISQVEQRQGWVAQANNPTGDTSQFNITEARAYASSVADTVTPMEYGLAFCVRISASVAGAGCIAGWLDGGNPASLLRGAAPVSTRLFLGLTAEPSVSGPNWWARCKPTTSNGYRVSVDTGVPFTTDANVEMVIRTGPERAATVAVNGVRVIGVTGGDVPGAPPDVPGALLSPSWCYGTAPASVFTLQRIYLWCREAS